MPPRKQVAEMPFIAWTGGKEDDPETRKLIRSRVMLGKNRGKSRPTKRKEPATRHVVPVSESSSSDDEKALVQVNVPTRLGTELSFTQLPAAIDRATLADLLKFSAVSKQATVPLEPCFYWDKKDTTLSKPLGYDAAYLHSVALGSQTYVSIRRGRDRFDAARCISPHFSKAVRLLRERLLSEDEIIKISDPTILVVTSLAFYARMTGDYETALHHIDGLRRMVDLRGGIVALNYSPKLLMEICRCDLAIAIESGSMPVLFPTDSTPGGGFMAFPDQILPSDSVSRASKTPTPESDSSELLDSMDDGLAEIWRALQNFCTLVNHAAETKRRLPEQLLMETTCSVVYRLLHMAFDPGSLNEAIRLALLGFTSFTFLQWPNVWMQSVPLSTRYKECLIHLHNPENVSNEIMLWLLIMGGTSIFTGEDDIWLRPRFLSIIEGMEVNTYSELRNILDSFVWIDLVFGKPAQRIFNSWMLFGTGESDQTSSPSWSSTTNSSSATDAQHFIVP